MTIEEALCKIAEHLSDIELDEMTKSEIKIAEILEKIKYLKKEIKIVGEESDYCYEELVFKKIK